MCVGCMGRHEALLRTRRCNVKVTNPCFAALEQVLFYTHWMARLTSGTAVALVYLFFAASALLQK